MKKLYQIGYKQDIIRLIKDGFSDTYIQTWIWAKYINQYTIEAITKHINLFRRSK